MRSTYPTHEALRALACELPAFLALAGMFAAAVLWFEGLGL